MALNTGRVHVKYAVMLNALSVCVTECDVSDVNLMLKSVNTALKSSVMPAFVNFMQGLRVLKLSVTSVFVNLMEGCGVLKSSVMSVFANLNAGSRCAVVKCDVSFCQLDAG